nr:nitrogenase component 1 [Eubacterium sp.]
MDQVAKIISIYAADVSGAASALFELGGMTVIHDPSGCNSTYNTHDETRWYNTDSLIFISALTQHDAVMGNDKKFIDDVESAAREFNPEFICLCGTPVPFMMGTDFKALARKIEKDTGIVTFSADTNNMHAYFQGAGQALAQIARRIVLNPDKNEAPDGAPSDNPPCAKTPSIPINILGVTPLDFSANGSHKSVVDALESRGFEVISSWAMDSTLDDIKRSASARANLVVSTTGLYPAKVLEERFGTPYVVCLPLGEEGADEAAQMLRDAAEHPGGSSLHNSNQPIPCELASGNDAGLHKTARGDTPAAASPTVTLIGEAVANVSIANALEASAARGGKPVSTRVISPLDTPEELLRPGDVREEDEDRIVPLLADTEVIIADPMYRPICPDGARFVALPHEGFSGRIYRNEIPDLVKDGIIGLNRNIM